VFGDRISSLILEILLHCTNAFRQIEFDSINQALLVGADHGHRSHKPINDIQPKAQLAFGHVFDLIDKLPWDDDGPFVGRRDLENTIWILWSTLATCKKSVKL
jgi:hypothetical protein